MSRPPGLRGGSAAVSLLILAGVAVPAATFAAGHWTLEDLRVYVDAAQRLRDGEPLYSTTNPLAAYQYAPWFAAAWLPATYLPYPVVAVAWSVVVVVASFVAVIPALRRASPAAIALALLMLPILLFSSARSGNVQPLVVAVLVLGLERRWGPAAIAAAASLKAFPLAFILVYLGRRQWARAAWAAALTAVLVLPMLLFDLSRYTADGPRAGTVYDLSPYLWAGAVAGLVAATTWLAARRSPLDWLAAATTVVVGLPRMLTYDLTFLLAALPAARRSPSSAVPSSTKLIS